LTNHKSGSTKSESTESQASSKSKSADQTKALEDVTKQLIDLQSSYDYYKDEAQQ
jgi:hypothetical protein